MEEPKRVVISYHNGVDRYKRGQKRLSDSLFNNWIGEARMYNPQNSNFRDHRENPYAFKIDAFNAARNEGFTQILYVDCSMWAIKDVQRLFDTMDETGHIMEYAGHWTGTWTNDKTLDYFGMTRDQAMQIPMFSAGFLGLDFNDPTSHEFFKRWEVACDHGTFKGNWTNNGSESADVRCQGHRHDMSSASIIANELDMHIDQCGDWFAYIGSAYGTPKQSAIFYAQGL